MNQQSIIEGLHNRIDELERRIEQYKAMEEKLRESEEIYKTISQKSFAGIYVVQDGRFCNVNENAASYAGYTVEALVGRESDCAIHPDDKQNVKKNAREMLRGIRTAPHVFRVITGQGNVRWIMETVTSISYGGRPAILGNCMDITEHKLAEERLRESENLYRAIFETTGTATIIIEEDTTVSLVNTEFITMSGFTREEWEGKKSWTEFVVPADVKRMKQYHHLRRVDPESVPRNYEFGFIDNQGNIRDVIVTVGMIPGTKKSVASVLDITDLKLAEKKLRESEDLYRTIFENTGMATIIIEEDTTVSLVNTEFIKMSGFNREEWEGKKSWTGFVVPTDVERMKGYHYLRRENANAAPRNYEFGFIDSRGRIRDVMLTIGMIPGTKKSVASFADITEFKLAEQKVRESENLYRTIFETTGTATIIIEEDMTLSLVNTEFENLSKAPREYWEGKRKWTEFVTRKDLARMQGYHKKRRIDPATAPRNYEFLFLDKENNLKNVIITIGMIPGTKKSVASFADITEQKHSEAALRKREREVQLKSRNLEEVNTALKVLLTQREEDKSEMEEKVLSNVKGLVLPYIEKLKNSRISKRDMSFVSILESNLINIISPFSHRLSSRHLNLTPKELQVANLIKDGRTTKEISEMMGICAGAVALHRNHVRTKLGIKGKKINLQSYLGSLS